MDLEAAIAAITVLGSTLLQVDLPAEKGTAHPAMCLE
jgi:hypothetical protein